MKINALNFLISICSIFILTGCGQSPEEKFDSVDTLSKDISLEFLKYCGEKINARDAMFLYDRFADKGRKSFSEKGEKTFENFSSDNDVKLILENPDHKVWEMSMVDIYPEVSVKIVGTPETCKYGGEWIKYETKDGRVGHVVLRNQRLLFTPPNF